MLALADRWWAPTLRGAVAIVFGLLAILWPALALVTLVALFGAYALVDGVIALASLVSGRMRSRTAPGRASVPWAMQLVVGVAGIAAGLGTLFYPGITSVILLSFIGAYALVVGVAQIVAALRQRHEPGAVSLGIGGALAALFGVLVLARPAAGALALAWFIGIFAIAIGVALVTMGLTLQRVKQAQPRLVSTLMPEERAKVEK